MEMKDRLLERFLTYAKIRTYSDESSSETPSTKMQFDLARVLEQEMKEIGVSNVHVDEHCYVYGMIPATNGCENAPAIGFIAHMDIVDDCGIEQVNPVVHVDYDGKDIFLPAGNKTIKVKDYPYLEEMKGRTIITSDGTTVLGADDKAGVAEIMTLADELIRSKVPHGKICIAFTPDEEIGSGADLLDLKDFGADFGYTADGDLEGCIEYENFNAASALITIHGVNVHPGSAKDKMVNSAEVACELVSLLPEEAKPCKTEGYEGFFHLTEMSGNVEQTVMHFIIRDHDKKKFEEKKQLMADLCEKLNEKWGEGTVEAVIKDSYFNMADIINKNIHLVEHAVKAIEKAGTTARISPVRGGTDGAALSFRGLPCPNLGTGGNAFHGPYEHVSLEGMETCVNIMLNIVSSYLDK